MQELHEAAGVEEDQQEEEMRDVPEAEELDTEEQEELHDDDTHSVLSDFEVIPLPECFDTSKPLGSLEKEEEEKEGMFIEKRADRFFSLKRL